MVASAAKTAIPCDPVALTARLIKCPSVTPKDAGALAVVEETLSAAGFTCTRVPRGGIDNLFAVWGTQGAAFGFNGHTDVVPVGDRDAWSSDPFGATEHDGQLFGRGTQDMKSGVAAFIAAAIDFVTETPPNGRVMLAITGDEEGDGIDGTAALLDWMGAQGQSMDVCLVGEPTCPNHMGEMIKIGRRGSMTAHLIARGFQGHSAYPHLAKNPIPALVRLLDRLAHARLDEGTDHFDPSTLAVTSVDVGNPVNNVIPATARATLNIRFNDAHSSASLCDWLREQIAEVSAQFAIDFEVEFKISGESFLTPPGALSDLVASAVEAETGIVPVLSTSGGTSDARFVIHHCPVVEFGLVGNKMHQVDESVPVAQIVQLKEIYKRILTGYFV